MGRKRERVDPSTELCVAVTEEGALVVETREQGLRRARALLRKYIPEGVNLSDELIAERRAEARMKGYTGEACPECGNFTMVRNGTCLKCDTCGSTSGCS